MTAAPARARHDAAISRSNLGSGAARVLQRRLTLQDPGAPVKPPKDKTPTVQPATLLTASDRVYLDIAGTNIEDLDRALKSSGWRAARKDGKDEQLER
jgi:hypothetical protein